MSDGNKCYCGFDEAFLDEDWREDECRTPCAGDDAFTCGEDDEFELYKLYDDIPDSGSKPDTPSESPIDFTASPTPSPTEAQPVSPTEPMAPTGDEPEGTDIHTYVGCYDTAKQDLTTEFDFMKQITDEDMTPSASVGWGMGEKILGYPYRTRFPATVCVFSSSVLLVVSVFLKFFV